MLRRNACIKILDLSDERWDGDLDYKLSSAVAEGLVNNSTLETARLPFEDSSLTGSEILFNGPVWQEMLESKRSLKTLSFAYCAISLEGFDCLARGLSSNTSLEFLDLSTTEMGNASVIALVDGLGSNKTLKCLDLSYNRKLSQSGRDAIERLLGYNVLRELIIVTTKRSIGVSISASGLSGNHSIEKLNLESTFVRGEGSETFRARSESLRENTTVRFLDVWS